MMKVSEVNFKMDTTALIIEASFIPEATIPNIHQISTELNNHVCHP